MKKLGIVEFFKVNPYDHLPKNKDSAKKASYIRKPVEERIDSSRVLLCLVRQAQGKSEQVRPSWEVIGVSSVDDRRLVLRKAYIVRMHQRPDALA